jgi:hypothetical protein
VMVFNKQTTIDKSSETKSFPVLVGAIADMGVPEGELIDRKAGGLTSFRNFLNKVKAESFTGYMQSSLALEGHDSSGILLFEQGQPVLAIYSFRPSGNDTVEIIYRGERALEFVCSDSLNNGSALELRRIDDPKLTEGLVKGRGPTKEFTKALDRFYQTRVAMPQEKGGKEKKEKGPPESVDSLSEHILDFHRRTSIERTSPKRREIVIDVDLIEGNSYLVEESNRDYSHAVFSMLVQKGMPGLAITRSNPKVLRSSLEGGSARILWLTDHEAKGEDTVPPSLEKIMVVIEEFLAKAEESTIILDDLQYLISSNNFEGAVRFIRSLVDKVSEQHAIFLLSVDPNSLSTQERSIVERELSVLVSR